MKKGTEEKAGRLQQRLLPLPLPLLPLAGSASTSEGSAAVGLQGEGVGNRCSCRWRTLPQPDFKRCCRLREARRCFSIPTHNAGWARTWTCPASRTPSPARHPPWGRFLSLSPPLSLRWFPQAYLIRNRRQGVAQPRLPGSAVMAQGLAGFQSALTADGAVEKLSAAWLPRKRRSCPPERKRDGVKTQEIGRHGTIDDIPRRGRHTCCWRSEGGCPIVAHLPAKRQACRVQNEP